MSTPGFDAMFLRLLTAEGQSRSAKTVAAFGWLMLVEAAIVLAAPQFVAAVLHLPAFTEQGANYFRLVGLLVGGLGMLYVVSGRLNAQGFVFASLLDRPLVPFAMAILWYHGGEMVTGSGGQAAVGMVKLLAVAEDIVTHSTAPEAKGFDSAKWLGQWIERPQPSLGGRKPADLIGTPTGLEVVARLLGSIESGAYQ